MGWPGGTTVAKVSVGVVSETEVETLDGTLDDTFGDSPGGTIEDALVDIDRTDDVLVRDPIAKLLVFPMAIDDEVMGELVLDGANGNPSVPVGCGNVLPVKVIGNPSVPVPSDVGLLDEAAEGVSDEVGSAEESKVEREEEAGSPGVAGSPVEFLELKAVESAAVLVCELSSVKVVVESTGPVVVVLVFVKLNG